MTSLTSLPRAAHDMKYAKCISLLLHKNSNDHVFVVASLNVMLVYVCVYIYRGHNGAVNLYI